MPVRPFPPPWSLEELNDARFVVRDSDAQQLAYVYFEEELAALLVIIRIKAC